MYYKVCRKIRGKYFSAVFSCHKELHHLMVKYPIGEPLSTNDGSPLMAFLEEKFARDFIKNLNDSSWDTKDINSQFPLVVLKCEGIPSQKPAVIIPITDLCHMDRKNVRSYLKYFWANFERTSLKKSAPEGTVPLESITLIEEIK